MGKNVVLSDDVAAKLDSMREMARSIGSGSSYDAVLRRLLNLEQCKRKEPERGSMGRPVSKQYLALRTLEVDQSVFFRWIFKSDKPGTEASNADSVRLAVARAAARTGFSLACTYTPLGVRVTRTK